MIEPTYRRDQLWSTPRRGVRTAILVGAGVGLAVTLAALVSLSTPRKLVFIEDSPASRAELIVAKLAHESFPAWRAHHAGCPHRLANLGARLDPWGHAMHYTCDPRLASGHEFAVISAGQDGVFGTADDIEARR